MRLDYTVLCIDDNIGTLRDTKRAITEHNDSVGIRTNFVDTEVKQGARETDIEEFRLRIFDDISEKLKKNSIDLVIVDLHLGELKGHEIIDHMREPQTMYRPIVFYSGGEPEGEATALQQLQDALTKNDLVGKSVFVSARGRNLVKHLRGICSEMHAEEHKLNASRGLLMDQTSEIDAKTLMYLRSEGAWLGLTDEQVSSLHKDLKIELTRQVKNADSKSGSMAKLKEKSPDEIISWVKEAQPTELDAMGWNKFLRALLKVRAKTLDHAEIHKSYFNDTDGNLSVSKLRNQYAHQTAEQIGDDHDFNRCKFIRDELRKHLENIKQLTKASS